MLSRTGVFLTLLLLAGPTLAQEYPTRTVTIVIGFPAGSPPDIHGRPLAQHLERAFKRSVVIEPRVGAGGLVSANTVMKADPDGHTLLLASASLPAYRVLYKDVGFDPIRDPVPISMLVNLPSGFITSAKLPIKNVDEFVAHVKANPGKLNYGSVGTSTTTLILESFKRATGLQLSEIPYAGMQQQIVAMLQNDLHLMVGAFNLQLKAQADANELRPLAIIGNTRSPLFPGVPSTGEKGWNIPSNGWFALVAPPRTPKAVVDRIAAEVARYVASPEAKKHATDLNVEMIGSTPDQLRQVMERDGKTWADVAAAVGMKPQ
jgi:tripartite-type tricarboxylate transporter receptor subunit TctC